VLALWAASPYLARLLASLPGTSDKDGVVAIADQFGVTSSLFTALAFAALVVSIYQQQQDLRVQRQDLGVSIKAMEKSAKAQTAQVKINTLSALLASLPVLIREEETRIKKLDYENCYNLHEHLESFTAEELHGMLDTIAGQVEKAHSRLEEQQAKLDERPASDADAEARRQLRTDTEDLSIYDRLTSALPRLIALRRELADTYEEMRTIRSQPEAPGGAPEATA